MIETIFISFIVAKMKGHKLLPILKDWSIYPVLICATTYIYLESTIWHGDYSLVKYAAYFKVIYLSCFIILAIKSNQIKPLLCGLPLVWIGYILNYIAVKANQGAMPVFPSISWWTGYAKPEMFINPQGFGDYHVLGTPYTNLIPACDIFDVGYGVWSIGDILIRTFAFIIIYTAIKSRNQLNKYND